MRTRPTVADVIRARDRIQPYIRRTPLVPADKMDETLGCRVYLKPEMLQITGAFKLRGVMSKILTLSKEELERGLITSSSGNNGQALSYAARKFGAKAVVVVNAWAPEMKLRPARAYGAETILFDGGLAEKWGYVDRLVGEKGYTMIHAGEDPAVMAGLGTIALEVYEDDNEIDTLVVPLGGGGMLAGCAIAMKELNPGCRIIGVEAANAPKFYESRRQGAFTTVPIQPTIADGIMEGIPGKMAYPIVEELVDEIALVDEAYIAEAIRLLAGDAKLVSEGAGAVGVGAALQGTIRFSPDEKVCFVLSGGNIDLKQLASIVDGV